MPRGLLSMRREFRRRPRPARSSRTAKLAVRTQNSTGARMPRPAHNAKIGIGRIIRRSLCEMKTHAANRERHSGSFGRQESICQFPQDMRARRRNALEPHLDAEVCGGGFPGVPFPMHLVPVDAADATDPWVVQVRQCGFGGGLPDEASGIREEN